MHLKDYIQDNRRGKEANRLEREAMNDPFLQDALDGFDAVAGDHVPIIERLEKKFANPAVVHHRVRTLWYWSVAASVLLLIGMSVYFLMESAEKSTTVIAMNQPNENEDVIPVDSMTPQIKKLKQETPAPQEKLATPKMKEFFKVPETDTDVVVADVDMNLDEAVAIADVHEVAVTEEVFVKNSAKSLLISEQKMPSVHGKVLDETGNPIPGVSIIVKGTTTGTITDVKGNFALPAATDSSKLIASFIGYETREIKPSGEEQTVILKSSDLALEEVVVVAFGARKKQTATSTVPSISVSEIVAHPFGEKEFQTWCQQNGNKNVCEGHGTTVKISFFIDETGKPTNIEYKKYSCEDAKEEMEKLLSSSPVWTKTNRKVTLTVGW